MKLINLLSLHVIASVFSLRAKTQDDTYAFSEMVSSLKLKSAAHEKEVAKLLSSTDLQPTNFVVPTSELTQPALTPVNAQTEVPPAPYLPVPDYYEVVELTDTPDSLSSVVQNQNPADWVVVDSEVGLDLNNTDSPSNDDTVPVPKIIFERHDGYYFGPSFGFTLPDDGAVRDAGGQVQSLMTDAGYFWAPDGKRLWYREIG